jgi:hypothetical protein
VMTYSQSTGKLTLDEALFTIGYAGHGAGLNNPAMQDQVMIGPLPQGFYSIGEAYDNPHTGPHTMNLTPDPANHMFGRSLFRIHGDNGAMNHTASDGCIIVQLPARMKIVGMEPKPRLQVIA